MLVMGIESSAHTFGVGIVRNGRIIANEKSVYPISDKGMIPSKVSNFHVANADSVIRSALKRAKVSFKDLDGIGYTKGPGLGPCLQVGELSAKTIAKMLGIPIVPVHHGTAHAEITKRIAKLRDPITLYVSGGNSQILEFQNKHYHVLGETFDIGIGNMLDAFARNLHLRPAWGSTVAKIAENGKYIEMPYTVKGMDFSFTGLLTRATELIGKARKQDLCYSIQETAFAMLCEATERALLLSNKKELCVCGGVAQSKRLRQMLQTMSNEHGTRFAYADDQYNADNGAMIALVAEQLLKKGHKTRLEDCNIEQRYRIEKAIVS